MKTLLKDIISNNGATLTKAGDKVCLSKGWQVSKRDLLIIPVYKLRKYLIKDMLSSIDDGDCLGIWIFKQKCGKISATKLFDSAIQESDG